MTACRVRDAVRRHPRAAARRRGAARNSREPRWCTASPGGHRRPHRFVRRWREDRAAGADGLVQSSALTRASKGAPPGIRTQNLRIKSRSRNVLAVLSCAVLAAQVRCVVRPVRRVMRDIGEKGDKNGDKFCVRVRSSASCGWRERSSGTTRQTVPRYPRPRNMVRKKEGPAGAGRRTARGRRRRRPTAVALWSPGVAGLVGGDEAGSLRARRGPVGAGGGQVGPDLLHVPGAQAAGGSRRLDVIELG
jgi:hypothetical protein